MVTRRGLVVAIGAIGGGGYFYSTNGAVKTQIDEVAGGALQGVFGPPPTETMIGSVEGTRSLVQKIEFYESGAAKIYPKSDHACYEAMAFRHEDTNLSMTSTGTADTSDALATWSFGEFDEVLTVDMIGAIENKSNYPNSTFVLQMVSQDGVCISVNSDLTFQVPESYLSQ
mgnify:CR=1 FL=1